MNSKQVAVILKSFDAPDEVRLMQKGKFELVHLGGISIGRHAGNLFYVPPVPHDSWVIGDEPYVSLHFLGAETYATKSQG